MKSDVYFVKARNDKSRESSLKKLIDKTQQIFPLRQDEIVPIKITVGDSRCVYNIGPQVVRAAVSFLKRQKARPFLFDTNVIYSGERQNAVDHLNLVQSKGFGHSRAGAPYIIADGVFGRDGCELDIASSVLKKIKVPSFVGMLDSLVVLSHITGHILAGYAGAIKNVAMGMSCRPTKQVQHSSLRPHIIREKCALCRCCMEICPVKAIAQRGNTAEIDKALCLGCGECLCACKFDAVSVNWDEDEDIFARRMAETAQAILDKFKNKLFINFAWDISKECDCISTAKEEIIAADLGILASSDILALEKATVDLVRQTGKDFPGGNRADKMLSAGHRAGLGNLEYRLIEIVNRP